MQELDCLSRRQLIRAVGSGVLGTFASLRANPLGLPAGLQLWSVQEELAKNFEGTLRQIARIGFRELELYRLPEDPAKFRRQCEDAGLKCVSGHFQLYTMSDAHTVGG